jgi:hypothetical protein
MLKRGKSRELLKPLPLTIAVAASWAALHEPQNLNAACAAVWGLETLAVALVVRAMLALALPVLALGLVLPMALLRHPGKGKQAEP